MKQETSVEEQLTHFTMVKHVNKPKNTNAYNNKRSNNNKTTCIKNQNQTSNNKKFFFLKQQQQQKMQQETRENIIEENNKNKLAMTSNNLVCDVVLRLAGKKQIIFQYKSCTHWINMFMTNWCLLSTCVSSLFAQMTRWMENQLSLPPPTAMLSGSKAGNCCASK